MISINPAELSPRDAYRLLISTVVPRPIGWISSIGLDGSLNLAPYSFFNGVGGNPPMVMVSVSKRDMLPKDTLRNIQETNEFVVNIVDESLAESMNMTSGEYGYEVDEFDLAGLDTAPSLVVQPPRVASAPAAMECTASQIIPVDNTRYTMVIGRVVYFHFKNGLVRQDGLVDIGALNPLARLGGDEYALLGKVIRMKRP